MARITAEVAQIYEDPEPTNSKKSHKRVPSVGDVLRGRRKENSPTTSGRAGRDECTSPSPLGERHINSPPQPKRIPLKRDESRPPMHKKTGSSVSLKEMIMGKQKSSDAASVSSTDGPPLKSPKKTKSSTNLAGLLKKRSRKDLHADSKNQENISPTRSKVASPTPIWAQFATQPLDAGNGTVHLPMSQTRSLEDEINLYTPRDYSEYRPAEQRNFHGFAPSPTDFRSPQRPYLEHRPSSRSSIFIENIDENEVPELDRPKSRDQHGSRPSSSRVQGIREAFEIQMPKQAPPEQKTKRSSRVLDAISTFNIRSREAVPSAPVAEQSLSPQELDTAFEKVLDARNIPQNMRDTMRNLKPELKAALMKGERSGSDSSSTSVALNDVRSSARSPTKAENDRPRTQAGEEKDGKRARSRSRPRSRVFTLSKRDDTSPAKAEKTESSTLSRSKPRPKSVDLASTRPASSRSLTSSPSMTSLAGPDSTTTPGDFIHYLREVQKPSLVEVGKLHKLRILLRNESVTWTDHFVTKGGMDELVQLLYRIIQVEWREEHEDNLLHETLLCMKALCTTDLAQECFARIAEEFFPTLLKMLFDPERKGPSEFSTRGVVISLLFAHLSAVQGADESRLETRARKILKFLQDPAPEDGKQVVEFVSQMHTSRPYRVWCKEVVNVTKEVFWIFLHHLNVVPILGSEMSLGFAQAHYPAPRPPHPAAPYVGGVEWEATQYLATHLDLLNGLIASLPTLDARNQLREEMKQSGWEKVMGGTLRTCKEKFYGSVHDGLRVWVCAAKADGWLIEDVRSGPPREQSSPKKSPMKKREAAPVIAVDVGAGIIPKMDDGWI
jgi:Diaphanous GTPase-binding Domain